jgi:hypothetical protein
VSSSNPKSPQGPRDPEEGRSDPAAPRRRPARRARLLSPGQLWGRRTILVGLILLLLAGFGAVLVLAEDDDDQEPAVEEVVEEEQSELGESLDDPKSGISVQWPSEWRKLEKGGVFAFQSPDRGVVVAISTPEEAAAADQLRKDSIAAISEQYGDPEVRPGKGTKIGGLEAAGAVISGKGPGGRSTTLVAVASGRSRAYLLEVVTAADAPEQELAGAQLILNSLELSK